MEENKQLAQWKGDFGDSYMARNSANSDAVMRRVRAFAQILRSIRHDNLTSVLEVGANVGINLRALSSLTSATLWALEPNDAARATLVADGVVAPERALAGSARSIPLPDKSVDLIFTSGVLIHIPPSDLEASYQEIYRACRRYIVCLEYFADKPTSVSYRGQEDLLFKRDFGDLWLTQYPRLRLIDYGFFWKRATGLDNLTWWAFEKP